MYFFILILCPLEIQWHPCRRGSRAGRRSPAMARQSAVVGYA